MATERVAFLECVSCYLFQFLLSVSRIPSGHWPVKISKDCALQSSRPPFCRVHSWRRLLLLAWRLPSFVLPRGGRRLRIRPFAAAFWWQHIELPLALSRQRLNLMPSFALSRRFAPARCLTIRAGLRRLGCCSSGLSSALPANSTPAVPMAFRARKPPPPSSTRLTPARSTCATRALSRRHAAPRYPRPPSSAIDNFPIASLSFLRILVRPGWQPPNLKN